MNKYNKVMWMCVYLLLLFVSPVIGQNNREMMNEEKHIQQLNSFLDKTYRDTRISGTGMKSDCETNLENIFKVRVFKEKYETVDYIYKHRERTFFKHHLSQNDSFLSRSFKLIKGVPYFKSENDSIFNQKKRELVKVEPMSKNEMNSYLEQLNYTPHEAYRDYKDFIQQIKHEKETYLKCIETELAKGSKSQYATVQLYYDFMQPGVSVLPPWITKFDFLIIFKEFILIDDAETLPDFLRVMAYLECGCKIPYFREFSRRYGK